MRCRLHFTLPSGNVGPFRVDAIYHTLCLFSINSVQENFKWQMANVKIQMAQKTICHLLFAICLLPFLSVRLPWSHEIFFGALHFSHPIPAL